MKRLKQFYLERIPENVVTIRHFDKWWRQKSKQNSNFLNFTPQMLRKDNDVLDKEYLYPKRLGPVEI